MANVRQCRITVYNYHNDHGVPFKMNVNAQCVGGDEGVFAVFLIGTERIGMAWGDDGHWQLADVHGRAWLDDIIEALQVIKRGSDENIHK